MSDSRITLQRIRPQTETQAFLVDLINRVIKNFENSYVKVSGHGRRQLIQPALPHSEDVEQALSKGSITVEFLEECVFSILRDALAIRVSRKRRRIRYQRIGRTRRFIITGEDISAAMKRNCPYVFWC
jgi:hypothetical protein